MSIHKEGDLTYADVTPRSVYFNRRQILRAMGIVGAAAIGGRVVSHLVSPETVALAGAKLNVTVKSPFSTTEKPNTFDDVTHYNNFYEFGTDKGDPAKYAKNFRTSPWTLTVEGEVKKPAQYSIEDIVKLAPLEERIYRHRCVEGWSMVVPWIGYSLSTLIKLSEPTEKARFVAFQSLYDPSQMPLRSHRIWLLLQRESLRRSSALEPGHRAPAWRNPQAQNAHV
jgi:sulfoxide reductase catalytic subunit YedY